MPFDALMIALIILGIMFSMIIGTVLSPEIGIFSSVNFFL